MTPVVEAIAAIARRRATAPALVWDGGALTWEELDCHAEALAAGLAGRGIGPGDRVALSIGNRWELVVALLGTLRRGATCAPLDTLLKPDEINDILQDLSPTCTLVAADVLELVRRGATRVAGEPGGLTGNPGHSPALVLYTSGSTGRPKGAMISPTAIAFASASWREVLALGEGDRVLAVLPLAHAYGLGGALLGPLTAGAPVVLVERFSPETVVAAVRDHGVTVLPGVATMFRRLLEAPALDRAALATLRIAVSGAAPCPWELAREWRARTGVRILRGYGMTEVFRPISYLADDPTDLADAIGRPVPAVELLVVDEEGRPVPAGESGELWIRSPAAMDGYLGAPDETSQVLRDGWFLTGDLATLTPEGYVRIVGRKRERILRGGYSVFPPEVEAVLLAHPAVVEAAVLGVPDATLGEEVAAFVALQAGCSASEDELVSYCKERLAAFKYPRRVTILEALPRSATGKVLKARLIS